MYVPDLGDQVPKQGTKLTRALGKLALRLTGWQIMGEFPNLPKLVLIGAPHTSNWDGFYGAATLMAIGLRVNWMGKNSLFPKPIAWLLRKLGGIPINRQISTGVVDQMLEVFQASDTLVLLMTPEGTRKRVKKWKTGFYYMAKKAEVPIVLGFVDYARKQLGFGPCIQPSADMIADFKKIRNFYADLTGKRAHLFNPDILGEGSEKSSVTANQDRNAERT